MDKANCGQAHFLEPILQRWVSDPKGPMATKTQTFSWTEEIRLGRWLRAPRWTCLADGSAPWLLSIWMVGLVLLLSGCSWGSDPVIRSDPSLDQFRAAFDLPRPDGLPPFPQDGQYYVGVGKSGARVTVRSGCVERTLMFERKEGAFECTSEFIEVRGPEMYDDLDLGRTFETLMFNLARRSEGLFCHFYDVRGYEPKPRSFEAAAAMANSWIERCAVVGGADATPSLAPTSPAR